MNPPAPLTEADLDEIERKNTWPADNHTVARLIAALRESWAHNAEMNANIGALVDQRCMALCERLAAAEACIDRCRDYSNVVRSGWVKHEELKRYIADYDAGKSR